MVRSRDVVQAEGSARTEGARRATGVRADGAAAGAGSLAPVWVPDAAHEALRDVVRAREAAKKDQLRARHRLGKFLLRHGRRPPTGINRWTQRYLLWVKGVRFAEAAHEATLLDYLHEVEHMADRRTRLEAALDEAVQALRDHRGTPPGLARVQADIQRTVDAGEIRLSKPRPGATRPRRAGRGSVEANTVKPLSNVPHPVPWTHICAMPPGTAHTPRAPRSAFDTQASRDARSGCTAPRSRPRRRGRPRGSERFGRGSLAP